MYPFTFKVTYWAYDEKEKPACGVLFADTYAEAAGKIEKTFGDELISIDRLYALEENDLITFDDEGIVTAEAIMASVERFN